MKHFKRELNPLTGAVEDFYWDDMDKKLTVRKRDQVGEVLEHNKRQANASIDQRHGNEMLHKAATIPMSVVVKWKQELGVDVFSSDPDQKKRVRQLLNDPDWRYLRTRNTTL